MFTSNCKIDDYIEIDENKQKPFLFAEDLFVPVLYRFYVCVCAWIFGQFPREPLANEQILNMNYERLFY